MTKYRSFYRIILLSALVICTANRDAAAAAPPAYHVSDLGTLGGTVSSGLGINDSGQVTGRSNTTGDDTYHAFLWTPTTPNSTSGTMTDLGTSSANYNNSSGQSINDNGQVIGFFGPTTVFGDSESFLWTPTTPNGTSGAMQGLGTLGGTSSYGLGINDSGQLTGSFYTPGVRPHAFVYDGTLHDLGTLGGSYSTGYRINDRGQVTGTSETAGNAAEHPFLWTPTTPNGASGAMIDLGSFGGKLSNGVGINESGQVVGHSYLPGDNFYHAFLWTPTPPNGTSGTMIDLGSFGGSFSAADGINDLGQVVGWTRTTGDAAEHAFLYTSGGGMVDLNSLIDPLSGWELYRANGINDAGQITGTGVIGGQGHAFLLTPVPEPSTLALIGLGATALAIRRSRRITNLMCLSCALSVTATAHAASYSVTDLGTLGGTESFGSGLNVGGQVAGASYTTGGAYHTFLWKPTTPNGATGTKTDLGTLGGTQSFGNGLNASGQVTGESSTTGDAADHAFLWKPTAPGGTSGTMYNLLTLGGTNSYGYGINAAGQVTGASDTAGDAATHAFLWKPSVPNGTSGTMYDLGTLGGTESSGSAINASGQVAGSSLKNGDSAYRAFLWKPTTPNGTSGTMYDLGTLGGTESFGGAINSSGQVAGFSYATGHAAYHAYLWTPTTPNGTSGTMQDLTTLGGLNSYSYNVGAGGQVVGASEIGITSDRTHAFLYTSGSGMVDLNTLIDPLSGWELSDAADINDAGQITGQGLIGGQYHAYLLTPVPIPGDFNGNGVVDAADYVVWRKTDGTLAGYNVWRTHFGQTTGSGASAASNSSSNVASNVPEPASLLLLVMTCVAAGFVRGRRGR